MNDATERSGDSSYESNRNDVANERQLKAQELAEDMMIHDVRNPLSSIISIADMLSTRELSEDDLLWIERITALGHRALRVLKTSSGYAQMERGNYELETATFDLLAAVRATLDKLKMMSERRSVTHQVLLNGREITDQSQLEVVADQFFLEQMLHNLFINALEASSPGELITIRIEAADPLVIEVHNPGVVPEAVRDEIFDKLASYQKEKGSGLGAYIAKLIAEQHGGTVDFTTSPAEGTVFRATLSVL